MAPVVGLNDTGGSADEARMLSDKMGCRRGSDAGTAAGIAGVGRTGCGSSGTAARRTSRRRNSATQTTTPMR